MTFHGVGLLTLGGLPATTSALNDRGGRSSILIPRDRPLDHTAVRPEIVSTP